MRAVCNRSKRLLQRTVMAGLLAGATALLMPAGAAGDAPKTRTPAARGGGPMTSGTTASAPRTPNGTARGATAGRSGTVTTRQGGSRGGASVTRSRRSRDRSRTDSDRHRRRHGGFGWVWGGYYGGYYYNPYFHWYPIYYSHYPSRGYEEFGGLDLNVRPKKTEVWVDGQYIGTAGKFDGFPGHLWLEKGRHELIFLRQGFETVRREINVLAGLVIDVELDLVPGETVPAEELTVFDQEELVARSRSRERDERDERDQEDIRVRERGDPDDREPLAERLVPARVELRVEPLDASVYLDGRFLGTGRELSRLRSPLSISPGEHVLEVVRPGFDSVERTIWLEAGEEASVEVALEAS